MSYQMHRAGFDRKTACRGHFSSDVDIPVVDSDDGVDYVDWDALKANGWRRDVNYTYRIINGETVHFADGQPV